MAHTGNKDRIVPSIGGLSVMLQLSGKAAVKKNSTHSLPCTATQDFSQFIGGMRRSLLYYLFEHHVIQREL